MQASLTFRGPRSLAGPSRNGLLALSPVPPSSSALRSSPSSSSSLQVSRAVLKEIDSMSQQGTARKQNEDRSCVATDLGSGVGTMAAVFDGHGGYATAEWLQENFPKYIRKYWGEVGSPEAATTEAFLAADRRILAPKKVGTDLGCHALGRPDSLTRATRSFVRSKRGSWGWWASAGSGVPSAGPPVPLRCCTRTARAPCTCWPQTPGTLAWCVVLL